ncbi:MAG: nitrous oxide reductase family maturation protein NosD [Natronomonas sp.]
MTRIETGFAVLVVCLLAATAIPFVVATPTDDEPTDYDLDLERQYEPPVIPDVASATVDGDSYESAQAAIDSAEPGETVVLEGRFEENVTLAVDNVTVRSGDAGALLDAGGEGDVLTVAAENVTVEDLWLRNSGYDAGSEDAGVFVRERADGAILKDLYLSEITFGIWINGADHVHIADSRIEGRTDVARRTDRGNGINLWETEGTVIERTEITDVRDGIFYSWAEGVVSRNNTMWDNRYGVHYMYSNDNRLEHNIAVDNDVGYALMVSNRLTIRDNVAARNDGTSGHGILVKDIERSDISGNVLIENIHGLYIYNAQDNRLADNLLLRNQVGGVTTAGSSGQEVVGNSFVDNDDPVLTTTQDVDVWNGTDRGNYWSNARVVDLNDDGQSEIRHRPAGLVEHLIAENPQAAVFADSPAFDAVRLAESSFPVVEAPGIVDRQPLVESPHEWRQYANHS